MMKKIAILLLVIFALLSCSDEDDRTYSISIRNNCLRDITDIKISMYSLDETPQKSLEVLQVGNESSKYKFHFDKTSSSGCGKYTEITISPIFEISYINELIHYEINIEMDNCHTDKVMLILEENDYQVVEL